MNNSHFSYDFSAILGNTASLKSPKPQPLQVEEQPQQKRLHFESSRAGGTFAIDNHLHWSQQQNAQFHQWKLEPVTNPETERMAREISTALLSIFGGAMPLIRFTSPPRGQTPADQPHAAQELAKVVAEQLNRPYEVCVERLTPDTQSSRSRIQNLRDTSDFYLLSSVQDDLFTIVVDDVSTTGSTLKRMRSMLNNIPTLLIVYVIWH